MTDARCTKKRRGPMHFYMNKGPEKILDLSHIRWAGNIELFGEEIQGRGFAGCVNGQIHLEDTVYSHRGEAIPLEFSALYAKLDGMVIDDMMKRKG